MKDTSRASLSSVKHTFDDELALLMAQKNVEFGMKSGVISPL
jgi:hypothetical protein